MFNCDCAPINDYNGLHLFISRDNGSTPTQNYLFKHDVANQANVWQSWVYKTADGSSGKQRLFPKAQQSTPLTMFNYGMRCDQHDSERISRSALSLSSPLTATGRGRTRSAATRLCMGHLPLREQQATFLRLPLVRTKRIKPLT